jgi:hypothetical protein
MDQLYNWQQMRGVAALAFLGLFIAYAFLVGAWQNWKARRLATHMTEQIQPASADPTMTRDSGDCRPLIRRVFPDETASAGTARRAA